ncbi:MAG: hypothetical protein GC160_17550 [Acidobacteria bacterium]|nr:hypothetical protein [Acidobacteriota bacterium]
MRGLRPVYLALFYPCWWLGQAVVGAAPALLAWLFLGARPSRVRIDWAGAFARAGRAAAGEVPDADLWTAWATLGCTVSLIALAVAWRRWRPPLLYATALVAWAGVAWGVARGLAEQRLVWETGAVLLGSFIALTGSLNRLPVGLLRQDYGRRLGGLTVSFLAPLTLATLAQGLRDFARPDAWALPAAAVATLLAARRAAWETEPEEAPWASPATVAAALATLLLATGAPHADRAAQAFRVDPPKADAVEAPPLPQAPPDFFFKGVNFTAEWPDPYGSATAARTLEDLAAYGVNAVALVPYASQRPDEPELRSSLRMERDELIEASAAKARSLGMRVLLKPQVWVRGGGLYPGDLHFDGDEERRRWFASYGGYIERQAALAQKIHADVFSVGVEFAQLSRYEQEWREIIAAVRTSYDGPLVYAANFGEEFESVRFWDALDYIGLDNYYPLPPDLSTAAIEARIEAVHRRYGKPVLFTEAGFSTYELTHQKPWEDRPGGAYSPEAQARCVEALLRGFYGKPWLHGIFWWKVGSAGLVDPRDDSHQIWGKPAMEVVRRFYADDARVDSE